MASPTLDQLLNSLHQDIHNKLALARSSFGHATTKGDASETVWLELFNQYLPKRYSADKAHVVDSKGQISEQIDVVIFDRQYSPFVLHFAGQKVVPAESVYAIFESKQTINAEQVAYAQTKIESVRRLNRTSLPIPHAGGKFPAKQPITILGGILTFESEWKPCFGDAIISALQRNQHMGKIDIGCIASHGYFFFDTATAEYNYINSDKAATGLLFKLISKLQFAGTVPMIDLEAYARWLSV